MLLIDAGDVRWELPPRTRRIHHAQALPKPNGGTTSAHAENTPRGTQLKWIGRNYLRARGEYWHYPAP